MLLEARLALVEAALKRAAADLETPRHRRDTGPPPLAQLPCDRNAYLAHEPGEALSVADALFQAIQHMRKGTTVRSEERYIERGSIEHHRVMRCPEDDRAFEVAPQERPIGRAARQFEPNRCNLPGGAPPGEFVQRGHGHIDEQARHRSRRLEPAIADDCLVTCDLDLDEFGAGQALVSGERPERVAKIRSVQCDDRGDAIAACDPFGTKANARGRVVELLLGCSQIRKKVARDPREGRHHAGTYAQSLDRDAELRKDAS
nr:hypothetical protein [Sphingomonas sp. Ant H11]